MFHHGTHLDVYGWEVWGMARLRRVTVKYKRNSDVEEKDAGGRVETMPVCSIKAPAGGWGAGYRK